MNEILRLKKIEDRTTKETAVHPPSKKRSVKKDVRKLVEKCNKLEFQKETQIYENDQLIKNEESQVFELENEIRQLQV